jgi:hypothetical protein
MNKVFIRTIVTASTLLLAFNPVRSADTPETLAAVQTVAPVEAVAIEPIAAVTAVQPVKAPGPVAVVMAPEPVEPIAEAESLKPGEFVWKPERAQAGPVEVVVSIPLQRAYVYRGGTLIGVSTVSTGKPGHTTPAGTFEILQKRPKHFSNRYNNAPMPYMQRLTWDGIALHAGHIPGRPASHGCVRLPLAFAKHLFGVTSVGASVHIIKLSPAPEEALAMVRGNGTYNGMGGPLEEVDAGTN